MKTFVINLPKDTERRAYITEIVEKYPFLDVEFVEAVYGKALTKEQLNHIFDVETAYKRYGRDLNPGEIGCTISHFNCYKKIREGNLPYALVLEDDITIIRDISKIADIAAKLPENQPWVLFLSADYWFTSKRRFDSDIDIAKIYDAVGTYAYIINKKGAELILSENARPSIVADNWSVCRRQGLKLYAIYPYLVDANIGPFESTIKQSFFGEVRKNMPFDMLYHAYVLAAVKKVLLKSGHFVSKIRKVR